MEALDESVVCMAVIMERIRIKIPLPLVWDILILILLDTGLPI